MLRAALCCVFAGGIIGVANGQWCESSLPPILAGSIPFWARRVWDSSFTRDTSGLLHLDSNNSHFTKTEGGADITA